MSVPIIGKIAWFKVTDYVYRLADYSGIEILYIDSQNRKKIRYLLDLHNLSFGCISKSDDEADEGLYIDEPGKPTRRHLRMAKDESEAVLEIIAMYKFLNMGK